MRSADEKCNTRINVMNDHQPALRPEAEDIDKASHTSVQVDTPERGDETGGFGSAPVLPCGRIDDAAKNYEVA